MGEINYSSSILLFVSCLFLLSCGGSIQKVEDYSLYDLTSPETSNLELVTVDGNTLSLSKISGLYVRNQGAASAVISNPGNTTSETIQFDLPNKKTTSFVTIIPEGNSINQEFGVLGLRNSSEPYPTGSFTYSGNAEVFINDGKALYGLTGNSNILFEFDGTNSKISGEITSLAGKKSFLDLSCRDCPASAVVDIIFTSGNICNGSRICFNSIELKNNNLDVPLTSNYKLESDGALFGPNSGELGTVFSVNDTELGSVEIRGAAVGKKN